MHGNSASSNGQVAGSSLFAKGIARAAMAAMLVLSLSPGANAAPVASEAGVPVAKVGAPSGAGLVPDGFPGINQSGVLTVMVEMQGQAAALSYADSLKATAARSGVASVGSLAPAARDSAIQAAVVVAKSQVSKNEAAQQAILPQLKALAVNGKVIFRTKSAYNGVSLQVARGQIDQLKTLPGVKDVHVHIPKFMTAASDIDFLNARQSWTKVNPSNPYGVHGEGIKVAIIDSGLDYVHTNFGGPGTPAAYASVTDTGPVPNAYFPSFKVPGGYDFAGDAYDGSNTPVPDANPMDSSNGHGTACASLIGGLGVASNGSTYVGTYDLATNIGGMRISPGFAPKAFLYPLRVFGVSGSTNLVIEAIDWAIDPNGDGNIADHMDVISMSLGANIGAATDPDSIAASNAAAAGVLVASAAGNAGDSYYIVSSPSVGTNTLSVAASFNDTGGYIYNSNVTPNSPPAIAGQSYKTIYGSPSPAVAPAGLTGNVVMADPPTGSADGVSPLLNAAAIAGNVCMIDRGVIGFANKVKLCQDAGAIATIVVQSAAGSGTPYPITMALTGPPTSSIPAVMIGLNEGAAIKAQLVPGPVNVTINNDSGFFSVATTAADTMASYSARGPRLGDSMLKPDITAPAEVVGIAVSLSGTSVGGFNGTSSATPHIAGIMALMRQLHPTWTVEELNSMVMNTATHNLFTGPGGTGDQYGAGRAGAGRVDVGNAVLANVVAYNADPGLYSVSFGVVEVPVASTVSLTKNITVSNKGTVPVTYNLSYADATPVNGASFTVGSGGPITVPAGGTVSVPITFDATGNLLKHVREASVPLQLPAGTSRQWLTEKTGYAVFTPTGGTEPVLRVALYASPKPASSMHATTTSVATGAPVASFNLALAGSEIDTGTAYPIDIKSLVKGFELQYTSPLIGSATPPTDPNVLKHIGVTSDYLERGAGTANTVLTFGLEGFGPATIPSYQSSDKEVYIDIDGDGNFDYAVYLSSAANGTAPSNAYFPVVVPLAGGGSFTRFRTNGFNPNALDTNAYNNNAVTIPVLAADIGLTGAGGTKFSYEVVTFDYQTGNLVDDSGLLTYDMANPGIDAQGGNLDPFFYFDLSTTTIPVNYNGINYQLNDSQGVLLLHMHNASGAPAEVVGVGPPVANLFWRHEFDFNYLWLMNVATATPIALPVVSGAAWVMAGSGDLDGDGKNDYVWYHAPSGTAYAWLMNGAGVKPGGVVLLGLVGAGWVIETVADLNGDGTADILWRHSGGAVYAWYMNPDATIASVVSLGAVATPDWRLAGTGRFDGNATQDIVWSYEVAGPLKGAAFAWLMNPAGGVSSVVNMGLNGGALVAKVGDFDGDGMADLLWRDDPSGANTLWYMNGTTLSVSEAMPVMPTGWEAGAKGDFNSDGKADLLWLLPSASGQLTQWLMNGRGNAPTVNNLGNVGSNWFLPGQ
ncbi:MAG: S8 family serine peptidase [Betaproteobacteria bacterium]